MDQHWDKLLDPPHRFLDNVIPLGLDTIVHPQESLLRLWAVGQSTTYGQQSSGIYMSPLPPGEAELPQGDLLPLNSMGLAQKNLLALVNDLVDKVSINLSLVTVMAQVSIPALVSMVLNMVSLPILVSIALITASLLALAPVIQGLTSLPNSADMALVQGSLLVWINMDQQQDKILDPLHRVLDKVVPLGLDIMVLPQDNFQVVGHSSPLRMVNKVQDHVSHLPPGEAGLPQGVLLTLNSMEVALENILALINMDLGKVSLLTVGHMVLSLDSHLVMLRIDLTLVSLKAQFHHLTVVSMVLLHGSLLVLMSKSVDHINLPVVLKALPLKGILALDHVALVQ
ncbi:Hornerin [Apodemus speciosus]|uniref:Hornerin n=1 Tax=Apodemus speciosus TaxID=105296 RepID=A0ABQ0ELQ7_APOSI